MNTRQSDNLRAPPSATTGTTTMSAIVQDRYGPTPEDLFRASENAADLTSLGELSESGALAPAIDRSYPLAEAATAIRHLLSGRTRGKLSVSPADTHTPNSGSTA